MPTQTWSKNTQPNHNGQVQNNLAKMTKRLFLCLYKMNLFLPKNFQSKKLGNLVMNNQFCPWKTISPRIFRNMKIFIRCFGFFKNMKFFIRFLRFFSTCSSSNSRHYMGSFPTPILSRLLFETRSWSVIKTFLPRARLNMVQSFNIGIQFNTKN